MDSDLASWLQFHTLVCAGLSILLFLLYLRLYRREFLKYWAFGWVAMTLSQALAWVGLSIEAPGLLIYYLDAAGWVGALLEASFMVLAGFAVQRGTLSVPVRAVVFGVGLMAAAGGALNEVLAIQSSEILSAAALLFFAWKFTLYHPSGSQATGLITSAFCILHAMHRVGFALTAVGVTALAPPVGFTDTILVFGLSLGLIGSVVEHAHSISMQVESLWESAGLGMVLVDKKGTVIRANPAFCALVGKPMEDVCGQPVADCYSDWRDSGPRRRVKLWSGRELWVDVSSSIVATPAGKATFSILRDVTNQVETERALEQSRQRMMLAFESTDDAVFDWNIATGDLFLAPKILDVLGSRAGEEEGGYRGLCAPEDRPKLDAALAIALGTRGNRFEVEHRMRTSSGETVWVLARGSIVAFTPEGTAARVAGTLRDISDRRRSEQDRERLRSELMQAQKLEAIGRLASGVAHDFNNLLTVILASSEAIVSMADDRALVEDCGREIHDACERASHLTSRLLAFSRKQVSQPRPLNVNDVVRDSEKMLRRLIGEDVSVHYSYGEIEDRVIADPREIDQVILNLAVNARDAMPDGGVLEVKTGAVMLGENSLGLKPGSHVTLRVSDNGHGMDESVRARIFEPFFTTKEAGKGTGLGLSTVLWIVKGLGGAVDVISRPGEGATFVLYFPAMRAGVEQAEEAGPVPDVRGAETILLVEDQDDVRRVLVGRLRSLGYDVIPASGGADALQALQNVRKHVDVLVTDVVMSDCRGPDLAEAVERLQPGIRKLYMSGYADGEVADGVGGAAYVQKPFTADQLAAHIRQLLPSREQARSAHG